MHENCWQQTNSYLNFFQGTLHDPSSSTPGCDELTSRCQTTPSIRALGRLTSPEDIANPTLLKVFRCAPVDYIQDADERVWNILDTDVHFIINSYCCCFSKKIGFSSVA